VHIFVDQLEKLILNPLTKKKNMKKLVLLLLGIISAIAVLAQGVDRVMVVQEIGTGTW
jgi:hypothetical protein